MVSVFGPGDALRCRVDVRAYYISPDGVTRLFKSPRVSARISDVRVQNSPMLFPLDRCTGADLWDLPLARYFVVMRL